MRGKNGDRRCYSHCSSPFSMCYKKKKITISFVFCLVIRTFAGEFQIPLPRWWNGRHEGLKIPWPVMAVRVRVPLAARLDKTSPVDVSVLRQRRGLLL